MTTKSVNTDAARYRALRREEVMVSMTHDGNTGSTPWLEGDELDKCADSLLAATPLEPFIEQAQPEAITDAVMQVYHRTSVGDALDYSDIYDAVKAVLAAPVAAQAQPVTVGEALESARWRNALVGLCDTDRIDSPEQAIANVKRRMWPMGLTQQPSSGADTDVRKILLDVVPGLDGMGHEVYAKSVGDVEKALTKMAQELEEWELGIRRHPDAQAQQPVSGVDGLTDAAIEMLAKQYDCHNAPGFKGFARAVAALAQQDADNVQGYDREAEVKAFEEAWVSGTQDLGEDYQAAKKAWLLKAQQATPVDDKSHPRFLAGYDAGMKDADSKFIAAWEEYVEASRMTDVLSIITGLFVGLVVGLAEQANSDMSKPITIHGGKERDITIHPPKKDNHGSTNQTNDR